MLGSMVIMKIVLMVLLLYFLLNCLIIKRNSRVIDTMHKMGSEKLGWNVPKLIVFLVFLFCAVFIFGVKKIDYSEQLELEKKINEVMEEKK